jgi:hypothetical protein
VPVDTDGTFCIYNSAPVDLVVDIQGAFSPQGSLHYHQLPARRLYDSRAQGSFNVSGR